MQSSDPVTTLLTHHIGIQFNALTCIAAKVLLPTLKIQAHNSHTRHTYVLFPKKIQCFRKRVAIS